MRKIIAIILFLVLLIILYGILYYQRVIKPLQDVAHDQDKTYQRIISLSPNITEILFALGLGDRIVGVTRFCSYPSEAKEKAPVGGYLDPNYEAILSLKPDVVIFLSEFETTKNFLAELGINYLTVSNKTVSDIRASIQLLGKEFGVERQAEHISTDIRSKINQIEKKTEDLIRPKILIVVERTMGTGVIEDVYVAGRSTFYDELIQMAGGINAFENEKIAYPILSAEGIIHLNPDFIIDLVPQLNQTGLSVATLKQDWQSLPQIDAVKNQNIHILSQDYAVIPGPRFIIFLEDLARIIHPEIDWDSDGDS
jgi:iron complex transport system substrate-binding protein